MRYSRQALLMFGAGALLGLAVVSANLTSLGRLASLTMAVGIALLPVALVADGLRRFRRAEAKAKPARRRAASKRPQPRRRR
jgi:lipopolysaccharide export LptBFGC system permease protein LptF